MSTRFFYVICNRQGSKNMNLEKYKELLRTRNYPNQDFCIIENEESRRLLNYSFLGRDLILSQKAISELILLLQHKIKTENFEANTVELSLFSAFVMFYCKIFNSTSSGRIKLKSKDLYKLQKQIEIHEELKKYRDAFVAHSGDYNEELAACVLVKEDSKIYLDTPIAFLSIPNFDRLEEYRKHLNIAVEWISTKSKNASESVWKSLGLSTDGGKFETFFE